MAKKLYKSFLGGSRTIMPNGKEILFRDGRCVTSDADVIAYLDNEIATGVSAFYVDPNEPEEVSAEEAIGSLKEQGVAEFLAANPALKEAYLAQLASQAQAPAEEPLPEQAPNPEEEGSTTGSNFNSSITTSANLVAGLVRNPNA